MEEVLETQKKFTTIRTAESKQNITHSALVLLITSQTFKILSMMLVIQRVIRKQVTYMFVWNKELTYNSQEVF